MIGPGYVYLIRLDRPLSPDHTARHYIGWCSDLQVRMHQHRTGGRHAARFLQVAKERGIRWRVIRVWRGDRNLERHIKKLKCGPRLASGRVVRGAYELTREEIVDTLIPF